jgi:hypothetical protein
MMLLACVFGNIDKKEAQVSVKGIVANTGD